MATRVIDGAEVESGSGNVFADLGLRDAGRGPLLLFFGMLAAQQSRITLPPAQFRDRNIETSADSRQALHRHLVNRSDFFFINADKISHSFSSRSCSCSSSNSGLKTITLSL